MPKLYAIIYWPKGEAKITTPRFITTGGINQITTFTSLEQADKRAFAEEEGGDYDCRVISLDSVAE